jgi:hypothetical protein
MENDFRIKTLNRLINNGIGYENKQTFEAFKTDFRAWHHETIFQLELFDKSFENEVTQMKNNNQLDYNITYIQNIVSALTSAREILKYKIQNEEGQTANEKFNVENNVQPNEKKLDELLNIIERFPRVVYQLSKRYTKGPSFEIKNEYDVQDLLHALLEIHFSDIRREDPVPSYAGSSSRVDFLLKNEKIVIEVKKTRSTLNDKVGDELIIDIEKYAIHPDCKTLVFFIYDPTQEIKNENQIINDLEMKHRDNISIKVKIIR